MRKVKVNIDDIRARIVDVYPFSHKTIKLSDSPHYAYLKGDKQMYIDYLRIAHQKDHSPEIYNRLIESFKGYLVGDFKNQYILCEEKDGKYVIIDGFHRSCILLHKGVKQIEILVK